jgi:hypothetical protein
VQLRVVRHRGEHAQQRIVLVAEPGQVDDHRRRALGRGLGDHRPDLGNGGGRQFAVEAYGRDSRAEIPVDRSFQHRSPLLAPPHR